MIFVHSRFVTMLGASLVLLAQLVPRTMFLIGEMTVKSALYLYYFGLNSVRSMHEAFRYGKNHAVNVLQ